MTFCEKVYRITDWYLVYCYTTGLKPLYNLTLVSTLNQEIGYAYLCFDGEKTLLYKTKANKSVLLLSTVNDDQVLCDKTRKPDIITLYNLESMMWILLIYENMSIFYNMINITWMNSLKS